MVWPSNEVEGGKKNPNAPGCYVMCTPAFLFNPIFIPLAVVADDLLYVAPLPFSTYL